MEKSTMKNKKENKYKNAGRFIAGKDELVKKSKSKK